MSPDETVTIHDDLDPDDFIQVGGWSRGLWLQVSQPPRSAVVYLDGEGVAALAEAIRPERKPIQAGDSIHINDAIYPEDCLSAEAGEHYVALSSNEDGVGAALIVITREDAEAFARFILEGTPGDTDCPDCGPDADAQLALPFEDLVPEWTFVTKAYRNN